MSKYFIFIPNLLSLLRIGLVYPILNNIFLGEFVISFIYFMVAAFTDALDGFLARKMQWQTYLGTILDPVADKLLLSGTIFILWLNEYIPLYIFIIFFGRDLVILLGAAVHMTLIETETPSPNILGKITTTLQVIYILLVMLLQILQYNISLIGLDIFIILITILSLIVYSKDWFISLNKYHNE
ncbi:CDP-alcohol phosphatidyltransferase family protein [Gammaproteobacteria bacterium]|nr:CDP-alcohol phosphatidyltransferase family protein [Gammaproteobacteria bacterium]